MVNVSFRTKVWLYLSIILVLLLCMVGYVYNSFDNIIKFYNQTVNQDVLKIETTESFKTHLLEYRNIQLYHKDTKDKKTMQKFSRELENIEDNLNNNLQQMFSIYKGDVKYYNIVVQLEQLWLYYLEESAKFIGYSEKNEMETINSVILVNSKDIYEQMVNLLTEIGNNNKELTKFNLSNIQVNTGEVQINILFTMLIMAFLIIIVFLLVWRFIKKIMLLGEVIDDVSKGQKVSNVPYIDLENEIGNLANSLNTFHNTMKEKEIISSERVKIKEEGNLRKKLLESELEKLKVNLYDKTDTMVLSLEDLKKKTNNVVIKADNTVNKAKTLRSDTSGSIKHVRVLVHSMELLGDSVQKVKNKIENTDALIGRVISESGITIKKSNSLSQTTAKVEKVVTVINSLIQQINILAIKSTIEASKINTNDSKEVVSIVGEIQMLSKQAVESINVISDQVGDIQDVSTVTKNSITNFVSEFVSLEAISKDIMSDIKQERIYMSDINNSMDYLKNTQDQVHKIVKKVTKSAENTDEVSQEVQDSFVTLAGSLDEVRTIINNFLQQVATD